VSLIGTLFCTRGVSAGSRVWVSGNVSIDDALVDAGLISGVDP
jgi:hypothetical protein